MGKKENVNLTLYNEEEKYWNERKEECEEEIKRANNVLKFHTEVKKMCEDKIKKAKPKRSVFGVKK